MIEDVMQRSRAARAARIAKRESAKAGTPDIQDEISIGRVISGLASGDYSEAELERLCKQWKRDRTAFTVKDEDVPAYPSITSQFNGPGTTWMSVNLCRADAQGEERGPSHFSSEGQDGDGEAVSKNDFDPLSFARVNRA